MPSFEDIPRFYLSRNQELVLAKKESCPASTVYQSLKHSCGDAVGYGTQSGDADLSRGAILRQLAVLLQPPALGVAVGGVVAAVETEESWCVVGGGDTALVEQAGDGDA